MADLVLTRVGKVYPGTPPVRAVRGVDLSVADGEFVVLVGPSGCGKSSLLRMVAGLETVSEGEIRIGERVVNGVHPRDRDIAMVFQDYALYPHMTVRRNLSLGLTLRRVPRDTVARRVSEAAALLGITELLDRRPGQLSGGQRQRVALGRAIVRQPACFLFDEPLSNLDARLRLHMRAELKALHLRLGVTTLYVTHDQEEAMTLGSRIVVLAEGAIQQVGSPLEIYRRPANRFVGGFLGTPPMNFIEGAVAEGTFEGGGVALPVESAHRGPAVLGLRPEALSEEPGGAPLALRVEVVEPLGDRMDVTLRTTDGLRLVARVPAAETYTPGDPATFYARPSDLHLFEDHPYGEALS